MFKLLFILIIVSCQTEDILDGIWDVPDVSTESDLSTTIESRSSEKNTDECECTPYYLCPEKNVHYGEGIFNIRMSGSEHCLDPLEKCCDDEDTSDLNESKPTKPIPPPLITTEKSSTLKPTAPYPAATSSQAFQTPGCGHPNYNSDNFYFSWTVAIYYAENNQLNHICNGALIHPKVVVTAARCFKDRKRRPKVRAGKNHQDRDVVGIIIHGQYSDNTYENDIALVFLKAPFHLSSDVNVVCLPPSDPKESILHSSKCVYNEGILPKSELSLVPREQCEQIFQYLTSKPTYTLHRSFICAQTEAEKDICVRETGSPLICPIKGQESRYYLMGILTWGVGCNNNRIPSIFDNLLYFRKWIDQKLKIKFIDTSIYNP